MIDIRIFGEPSAERMAEMIETIEDIRDDLPAGYYDILNETIELLKKVLRGKKMFELMKEVDKHET